MNDAKSGTRWTLSSLGIVTYELGLLLTVVGGIYRQISFFPDDDLTGLVFTGVISGLVWMMFFWLTAFFGGRTLIRHLLVSLCILQICAMATILLICRRLVPEKMEILSVLAQAAGAWLIYALILVAAFSGRWLIAKLGKRPQLPPQPNSKTANTGQ